MSKTDEKATELAELLQQDLRGIELDVMTNYTLADAMREGSTVTPMAHGWGDGSKACGLHAAVIAAKAREQL